MRVLTSFLLLFAATSTAFAAQSGAICDPVTHCVDILETHDADSFDYDVLRDEFTRHGIAGKRALMDMALGRDDQAAERALSILSNKYALTFADVNALTSLWTKRELKSLTRIFVRYPNANTRQMAIDTLGHLDSDVRAASRELIAASRGVQNPLRSTDFAKIAQAIVNEPTPQLLALVNQFDQSKTTPIYVRSLSNSDPNIVFTAYEFLYARDKALALNSLVATLKRLQDNEVDNALAISKLLRERHKSRPDGFYMNFASDVSKDTNMSASGRAAGFDVLLKSQNLRDVPAIENTSVQHKNLEHILGSVQKLDPDYIINLPKLAGDNSDRWLSILWAKLKTDRSARKSDFIYQIGRYNTPIAKEIIKEALTDKHDWRVISAAVQSAAAQGNTQVLSTVRGMVSSHPVTKVRAAVDMSLSSKRDRNKLQSPINSAKKRGPVERMNRKAAYCRAPATDVLDKARSLPYFDDVALGPNLRTARYKLTTAEPSKSGWLAGYDLGDTKGALIYFDNQSGAGDVLMDASIMAVIPVQRPPLGQTTSRFWVITKRSEDMQGGGTVYHATRTPNGTDVKLHVTLPDVPAYVSEAASGEIFIAFKHAESTNTLHANPPLLLSPNGSIARACEGTFRKASYQN